MLKVIINYQIILLIILLNCQTSWSDDNPPEYDLWLSNMTTSGESICVQVEDAHTSDSYYTRRDSVYYDGARSFWQIADYLTGDSDVSRWVHCAEYADDNYVFYLEARLDAETYNVPGYWRFPHGLYLSWLKSGDPIYITHLKRLRDRNPFYDPAAFGGAPTWYYQKYSREVAYSIQTHIWAQKAGVSPNNTALNTLVDMALNHLDEWHTGNFGDPDASQHFRQSFMVGLTMAALIEYYDEISQDARIPTAIQTAIDDLWLQMWVPDASNPGLGQSYPQFTPGYGSFWNWADWTGTEYDIDETHWASSPNVAPDLNNLISPAYAWIFKNTGLFEYRDKGDLIFAGGVKNAWLGYPKNFNQNYRWSFDYIKFRREGDAIHQRPPTPEIKSITIQ